MVRENRDKAPLAFEEDLERARDKLAQTPTLGLAVVNTKADGVRRLTLKRVRYYLCYRYDEGEDVVYVLALWHASRRSGPRI